MRVGFIGLGKLGLPVAETMATRHSVIGYDLRPVTSSAIGIAGGIEDVSSNSDIIFIAVQTPHDPRYDGSSPSSHLPSRDFDYGSVISVLDQLESCGVDGKTVVLISTVLPGTTRRLLAPRLSGADLVYNPYLIAMGTVVHDMVNPEMIMIGTSTGRRDARIDQLASFYEPLMMNSPRIVTGTWEEMESTKIFYNTFISAKIGLVNMIQDVAQRVGNMDADVVARALADSTQRIMGPSYMKPGMGDGGPCHPRDNIALRWLAEELDLGYDLFDSIMRAREVQARNLAIELCRHGLPVFIWGESFKPGVPYTDGSYSRLVAHYCRELGARVVFDGRSTEPAVYLLGHRRDWSAWLADISEGSVVVDPWRESAVPDGIRLVSWGNTRGSMA
jgi:UDPglucose 6-dehydrogenase